MSQTVLVLAHLKSKGSITPKEAYKLYSITRLADVIFKLRKHHHIISTITNGKNKFGKPCRYATYTLIEEE
jgi:hypothetical protein